jgi:aspartate/methionine/tyrosine aminotransferase
MFTAIRVSIDSFSSEIKDVFDLCLQLYAEENVVILPGKVFGSK